MTRDIRMLLTIIVGAALAGWLIVRLVSPAAETPEPRVAVGEAPLVQEPPAAVPRPGPAAEPTAKEAVDSVDDPSEAIVRDLDVLVQAVRNDIHLQDRAFPDTTRILDLPSVVHYVRAVEFWQPAFSKTEGD